MIKSKLSISKSKILNKLPKKTSRVGLHTAKEVGISVAIMSFADNVRGVMTKEKELDEAAKDVVKTTGTATAVGYITGGGLAYVGRRFSSVPFLKSFTESSLPGKMVTGVMLTGDTFKRYGDGEIDTTECILELGKTGLSSVAITCSGAVGQAIIPIPLVGELVGTYVGETITSVSYTEIISKIKEK